MTDALFDLSSYGRRGPGRRDHLSPGQIAQVARTVRRTPEVMVKVLSRGGQDLKAVGRHFEYLRLRDDEELEIETDDGHRIAGDSATKGLLEDWDLDLEEPRRSSDLAARGGGSTKLVHKLMFSMPAGTPPMKVLDAVKNFAREEFGLRHRYAMVLHTDEPHPHVHMVLKAVSERGERLHVRKAILREWRRGFAQHLRMLGVAANATDRSVRGVTEPRKLDAIYRPAHPKPGERVRFSTHMREREDAVDAELRAGSLKVEPGSASLVATRREVERNWRLVSEILINQGQPDLAAQVNQFAKEMAPPMTEKQWMAANTIGRTLDPPVRGRSTR